ncbi:MAG: DUF465 domain-containing protein [Alphaproteobacteria bacterium]|nr:DUF465 domain-containing protein [Alphaproteobacteria bacterium]
MNNIPDDPVQLRALLNQLREEHRDLDLVIETLQEQAVADQLQLTRLKRKKLRLKDQIAFLEDKLIPDIIA